MTEWIACAERMPEIAADEADGDEVLFWVAGGEMFLGYRDRRGHWWSDSHRFDDGEVTHWATPPGPPPRSAEQLAWEAPTAAAPLADILALRDEIEGDR